MALSHQPTRLRDDVGLRAQRDEQSRVVMGGDARKRSLDRLNRRQGPGAMCPYDVGDGLGQVRPLAELRNGLRCGLIRPLMVRQASRGTAVTVPNLGRPRSAIIIWKQ